MDFHLTPLSDIDRAVLTRAGLVGRGARAEVAAVAHRCAHGMPQVLLCAPVAHGRPFPTTFWLACPHLDRLIGAVESAHGVPALEREMELCPRDCEQYALLHARMRLAMIGRRRRAFMRAYRGGIYGAIRRGGVGGIRYDGAPRAKCVHLQAASYLATGHHPGAAFIERAISEWSCADANCMDGLDGI